LNFTEPPLLSIEKEIFNTLNQNFRTLEKMWRTFFEFLSSVNTILGTVCYPGFLLVGPKSSAKRKQEDFSLLKGKFFPVNRENLGNTLLIFGESFTSAKVFPKEREKNIIHVCRETAPHIWGKSS